MNATDEIARLQAAAKRARDGYHHEEAVACFERALEHDPTCAMAHWGIAYAIGPNYNKP